MANNVVTFGEKMLILSITGFTMFVQGEDFDLTYSGGDINMVLVEEFEKLIEGDASVRV